MFETWIEIDTEKIKKDGIYVLESFQNEIKKLFLKAHFEEVSPGHYILDDEKYSIIESLGLVVLVLDKNDSVISYIKKWTSYDNEDGKQDILKRCFGKT